MEIIFNTKIGLQTFAAGYALCCESGFKEFLRPFSLLKQHTLLLYQGLKAHEKHVKLFDLSLY